ncbi:MAG: 3-methyl-2-oxobutanoate dehydrogenase (2-methylpropanoyl-transferring) subunit alpha [Ponticaulis sp.]|nr:3-methyl-2-oxobutanoate dehydrogenase (2-methylpropanoyl-transferring) subunit alpha [Ponticaulis sp.]
MASSNKGIQVPTPRFRPGDRPNFDHLDVPQAGGLPKPAVDADSQNLKEFAFGLVRVLNHNHCAIGDWDPHLSSGMLLDGLKSMVLTRAYDNRMMKMQRTKRLSFYMKCLGEEAVAIAGAAALRDDDMLFPSYRQQGALIHRGADLVDMMCHCISNSRDNLLGRQLPVHYARKDLNWFSISGNLGTQFPQAVGWGVASRAKGNDAIACSWIGDGTSATGDFHAACTMASTYNAPVILNIVNNQWAISTHESIAAGSAESFAAKAIGYGIPGIRVDGNDFLAVYAVTKWAAERARAGLGPTLIETFTYRGEAHSTSDDPSKYRAQDEWKLWPLGDPVERLKSHLIVNGDWSEAEHDDYEAQCTDEVTKAWKESVSYGTLEDGPHSPVETIFEDVFTEQPWHLRRQRQALGY